jgi:hypothetical protein
VKKVLGISASSILIVGLCMAVVSCGESAPVTSNSVYPAEMNGNVIIPEYLCLGDTAIRNNEGESKVFWVVEISIENKFYEQVISDDCNNWQIEAGDEIYHLGEGLMSSLRTRDVTYLEKPEISTGQSGNMTFCFSVPDTLDVGDAILCYQGQEPCSYGELSGGDLVEAYDWNSKTVTQMSKCVNA